LFSWRDLRSVSLLRQPFYLPPWERIAGYCGW
jgi:hypothetical protein